MATSGLYFAKLVREDAGPPEQASHVFFVVRDDDGHSDLLFQTSDTTWQAYNTYGGNSLYTGSPAGRAYKVSYNRPINTRTLEPQSFVFNAEAPDGAVSRAERVRRQLLLRRRHRSHRIRNPRSQGLPVGWPRRVLVGASSATNVEAARDAGVHLAFFSGNEVFWKTRWENSIDGSGTPRRTLVCYKETHADAKIDPTGTWTGTWRDPRFSPPSDGGRPENALTGTIFAVNGYESRSIVVPQPEGRSRFWRNTAAAALALPTDTLTLPVGTLGYEWDASPDNGFRPAGLMHLSSATYTVPAELKDFGDLYGTGTVTHNLTLYRRGSALVFGAGTVQWSWGLDANHDFARPGGERRHAAGDRQFVRGHDRSAGLSDGGAHPREPLARQLGAGLDHPVSRQRSLAPDGWHTRHDQRHRHRLARHRRRRRGFGRRRGHVACGDRARELDVQVDTVGAGTV